MPRGVKAKTVDLVCPNCGKHFQKKEWEIRGDTTFCSVECYREYRKHGDENDFRKTGQVVHCAHCGKEIYRAQWELAQNQTHYCSQACKHAHENETGCQRTGVILTCEICGREFYRTRSDAAKSKSGHHYCSRQCAGKARRRQLKANCVVCGKEFAYVPSRAEKAKTCSEECRHRYQSTLVGELNACYKRVPVQCEICGKEIQVIPSKLAKQDHFFCSRECHQVWQRDEASTPEGKKRMAQMRIGYWSSRPSRTDTKPQRITNHLLNDLDIVFTNEYPMGYFIMDNYLIDYNLVIEVMGDYWHLHPMLFPALTETDIGRVRRDEIKHRRTLEMFGIEILYLWEDDLEKRSSLCKALIRNYVDTHGTLSDYNSFNYELHNGVLRRRSTRIVPYIEYALNAIPRKESVVC